MKNKTMNLCNTCSNSFAECNPENIEFGNGVGNDNVISCGNYKLKTVLNDEGCPNCGCETFAKHGDCGQIICCRCFEIY